MVQRALYSIVEVKLRRVEVYGGALLCDLLKGSEVQNHTTPHQPHPDSGGPSKAKRGFMLGLGGGTNEAARGP